MGTSTREKMKVEDVLHCSLPSWYNKFDKVTIESRVLDIPSEVLAYLQENGQLVLPKECNDDNYNGNENDYEDFGEVDWTKDEPEESEEAQQKSFPEFSDKILEALHSLG